MRGWGRLEKAMSKRECRNIAARGCPLLERPSPGRRTRSVAINEGGEGTLTGKENIDDGQRGKSASWQ